MNQDTIKRLIISYMKYMNAPTQQKMGANIYQRKGKAIFLNIGEESCFKEEEEYSDNKNIIARHQEPLNPLCSYCHFRTCLSTMNLSADSLNTAPVC